jgi:hypothetical protein
MQQMLFFCLAKLFLEREIFFREKSSGCKIDFFLSELFGTEWKVFKGEMF